MKYKLILKTFPYCNKENTIIREHSCEVNNIDEILNVINENYWHKDNRIYYGNYYLDIDWKKSQTEIKQYIQEYIESVEKYENEEVKN